MRAAPCSPGVERGPATLALPLDPPGLPRWTSTAVKATLRRMVASDPICGTAWCRGLAYAH
jgi:hypothetical protein